MHRDLLKGFEKVAIHFIKSTQLITDSICTVYRLHVRIRSRGDDTKQFSARRQQSLARQQMGTATAQLRELIDSKCKHTMAAAIPANRPRTSAILPSDKGACGQVVDGTLNCVGHDGQRIRCILLDRLSPETSNYIRQVAHGALCRMIFNPCYLSAHYCQSGDPDCQSTEPPV